MERSTEEVSSIKRTAPGEAYVAVLADQVHLDTGAAAHSLSLDSLAPATGSWAAAGEA